MTKLWEYFLLAVNGYGEFVSQYKMLPLAMGVLLYGAFGWKKLGERKIKIFLIYTGVMLVLLLVPVTAAVFLAYQSRFYDYGWIWSMVPLAPVIAWGVVTIVCVELPALWKQTGTGQEATGSREHRMRRLPVSLVSYGGMAAAILVLFLCGNQGQLKQVSEETLHQQQVAEAILHYMDENGGTQNITFWGPKEIMQYTRSHSGQVTLYYGRDMWDAKAGAYDYETYTPEEIAAYEWMELVSAPHNLYLIEINQTNASIDGALAEEIHLKRAVSEGVNHIVLPSGITGWMERKIQAAAVSEGMTVSALQVAEYTVWILH